MATSTQGASSRRSQSTDGRAEIEASNVKEVAMKARGPAMAAGAVVVGALALKSRRRRARVLGVPLPRSSELEMKSLAKTIGQASKELGKMSRKVSKDVERVGDQAERIGKILS